MLGEIAPDLIDVLGVDVIGVGRSTNVYGFRNENWKEWTAFGGIPLLVPGAFPTDPEPGGDILMYPCGDRSAPPRARMPKAGFYFDAIVRQEPIDEQHLNVEDNVEEFGPISDADLDHIRAEVERLEPTGLAIPLGLVPVVGCAEGLHVLERSEPAVGARIHVVPLQPVRSVAARLGADHPIEGRW